MSKQSKRNRRRCIETFAESVSAILVVLFGQFGGDLDWQSRTVMFVVAIRLALGHQFAPKGVVVVLFAGKGKGVEVKKGKNEGLSGEIVGKTRMGKVKVRLDNGTRWGNSIVKVDKHKLGKDKKK